MVVLYLCSTVLRDLLLRAFEVVVVGPKCLGAGTCERYKAIQKASVRKAFSNLRGGDLPKGMSSTRADLGSLRPAVGRRALRSLTV